jgi:hypothetical protein
MNMDERIDSGLARRAAPYGLAVSPDKDLYEYTDPRNEIAVERRWRPICERHGAAILGIRDVPTSIVRLELDGIEWDLEPLGAVERSVPTETFHRWRALEAEDVPFHWWLWGEEQPQRPKFRPLPETYASNWSEPMAMPRDPLLIGVIPTTPGRGVWVLIGRWFH